MVERTSAQGLDEFIGTCKKIEVVEGNFGQQIHMEIFPRDKSIVEGSKTGCFHNWIRKSPKVTEDSVPEGSIIDGMLKEIEATLKEAKKAEKVIDAFNLLIGKEILYRKKVLGKKFEGKEASDYWVPVALK